ncbi:ABC transporter permease [Rheinheimera soli]|uniref:Permease n=1 Tax=Rheinheimera soli TaxID=443616 RepID=A0ABU1W3Y2_9GAMM|nr:ABC transporter permease [Rheinheimera soli]MDR7122418.1 putative permease [Rheinheimera soli]
MLTIKDFSTALYGLSKAKGYAATVIVTLGVTLGALVAMFNLNYQIIAAPLPYQEADKLLVGSARWIDRNGQVLSERTLPQVMLQMYHQPSASLSDHGLFAYAGTYTLRDLPDAPLAEIAYTTPGFMRMYQMPILQGRAFDNTEELGSQLAVAVISEQFWRAHYQADPAILGRQITVDNQQFRVVGIAGAEFKQPDFYGPLMGAVDVWLPLDFDRPLHSIPAHRGSPFLFYLAKLADPKQRQQFEQEMRPQIASRWLETSADTPSVAGRQVIFQAHSLRDFLANDETQTLFMLAGALVLLLIAATNVTNLLLSRAVKQQRSFCIQAALGAQRKHLFAQVLAELSSLMFTAMLLALGVAEGVSMLLHRYGSDLIPLYIQLGFGWSSLAFAIIGSLLLTLAFAALISRRINMQALQQSLQSSGKGSGVQVSQRARQLLIGSQVMFAAILLVCSAQVLLQSISQLNKQVGFATEDRFQVYIEDTTPYPAANLSAAEQDAINRGRKDQMMQARDVLQQHPAIAMAAFANGAPASFYGPSGDRLMVLVSPDSPNQLLDARITHTDQYFMTLFNIDLLAGRGFTAQEVSSRAPVVVISETLARALSPDGQVLGQFLHSQGNQPPAEIIGIAADWYAADNELAKPEKYRVYSTLNPVFGRSLLLQLKPGQQIDRTAINAALTSVSPNYRVNRVVSIADNMTRLQYDNYLALSITSALVLLSFVLAAIGIYGVLSYSIQLRRFELGVRMAIGAGPARILRQLLSENLKPVVVGLILAALLLIALWFGLQNTTFMVELSNGGFAFPLLLIALLTVLTTLLSVWGILRKPAIYALQGQ